MARGRGPEDAVPLRYAGAMTYTLNPRGTPALLPRRDQVVLRSRRRASEKDSCGDRAGPGDVEWKSTQSNKEFSTFPVFTKAPNRPRHVCVSNFHDVDSGSCGIGMSTLTGRLGLG